MKPAEIRAMDDAKLAEQLTDLQGEWRTLRFQQAVGQLTNTARIGQIRKDIARIKTVQTEREIEAELASLAGAGVSITQLPAEQLSPLAQSEFRKQALDEQPPNPATAKAIANPTRIPSFSSEPKAHPHGQETPQNRRVAGQIATKRHCREGRLQEQPDAIPERDDEMSAKRAAHQRLRSQRANYARIHAHLGRHPAHVARLATHAAALLELGEGAKGRAVALVLVVPELDASGQTQPRPLPADAAVAGVSTFESASDARFTVDEPAFGVGRKRQQHGANECRQSDATTDCRGA